MKSQFISIKEASRITGKHSDTIRRLVKANSSNRKKIVRGKQGQYLIDKDWLLDHFETPQTQESHREPVSSENLHDEQHVEADKKTAQTSSESVKNANGEVLQALQAELQAKNRQIEQLHQIINEKEANTTKLQDQFQQMLHASQQLPQQSSVEVDPPASQPEPAETTKKHEDSMEIAQKTKPKPKRKSSKKKPAQKSKNSGKTRAKTEKPKPKKKWWKL